MNYVTAGALQPDEARVYEFVVRRFLGCCSDDAKGQTTTIGLAYGSETFHVNGLRVLERNYLDVYTYDKWDSSQPLPEFTLNEIIEPTEANITEGETSAPGYLTEPELIALMDANGIGTDATMAEHIAKIKERRYVDARPRGGGGPRSDPAPPTRGSTRGRGRGGRGGRGGSTSAGNGGGGGGMLEFIPTTLGTALIEGYDKVGLQTSLGKPFLRKEMELKMKAICEGRQLRREVVVEVLDQYREVYVLAKQNVEALKMVGVHVCI